MSGEIRPQLFEDRARAARLDRLTSNVRPELPRVDLDDARGAPGQTVPLGG